MIDNEQQLQSAIVELLNTHGDWLQVYKQLEIQQQESDDYSFLRNDLNSFFVYTMIRDKADLQQFSSVIEYTYKKYTHYNWGVEFNNFFYDGDANIELEEYIELDKYNNDCSTSDNIRYVFLDMDINAPVGKEIKLDKKNLPYLLAMLNEVNDNTVGCLWYAGYKSFLEHFVGNIKEIKPLIEMANNNSAFLKNDPGTHGNFFDSLFRELGRCYSDLTPAQHKANFKNLSKMVPNIQDIVVTTLFRNEGSAEENKANVSILNYCFTIEPLINTVDILDKKYKQLYQQHVSALKSDRYTDMKAFNNLANEATSALSVIAYKYNFKLDTHHIDTNQPFEYNYMYLKAMELKISNKQTIEISHDVAQYIEKLFSKQDNSFESQLFGIGSLLDKDTFLNYLKPYMLYQELDNQLPASSGKKKTRKI